MSAPTLQKVRAYCRSKYGADWWDTDKQTKKSRKAEARLALSDDPEENIPLCDLVKNVAQKEPALTRRMAAAATTTPTKKKAPIQKEPALTRRMAAAATTTPTKKKAPIITLDYSNDNFRVLRGDSTEFLDMVQKLNRDSFVTAYLSNASQIRPKGDKSYKYNIFYNKFMCVVPLAGTLTVKALTGNASGATNSPMVKNNPGTGSYGNIVIADETTRHILDGKFRQMFDTWPLIKKTFDKDFKNPCLQTAKGGRKIWRFHVAVLVRSYVIIVEQKWTLTNATDATDDLNIRCLIFKEKHFRANVVSQIHTRISNLGFDTLKL